MAKRNGRRLLSNVELASFCGQMAMILRAGMSVPEGLSIMLEDAGARQGREILEQLSETVEQTGSMAEAVRASGVFPEYAADMVDIGERSGRLDEVMASLRDYYEREEDIAKGVQSAVTYPLVMIGVMLVIVLILMTRVLPAFEEVLRQLGGGSGGLSENALSGARWISGAALVLLAVIAVGALVFVLLRRTARGRSWTSALGEKLPFTRKLRRQVAASRFAAGMALMLSSGLDPEQGLELVERLVDHQDTRSRIARCREEMTQGADFAEAVSSAGILSGVYARMAAIGYRTGTLDEVLARIADQYQEEVDSRIGRLVSILEPTLVAVLAVIVGAILLSVMLPLMSLMSGIG